MEFCDNCGSLMTADNGTWECNSCDEEQKVDESKKYVFTEEQNAEKTAFRDDESLNSLPKTEAQCPECENTEAHWYLQQTRAADEPETRFYICDDCEHQWREDD